MGIFDRLFGESSGAGGVAARDNPICTGCSTVYNRTEVIRLIKMQSPEIFDFEIWSTRFVCKRCSAHVVISGVRGE